MFTRFMSLKYKLCLLMSVIWAICSNQVWGAITAQERSALIAFYNATSGDNWGNNWKTPPLDSDGFSMPGTEGSWYGITVEGDHVIKIELNNQNVSGVIPPEIGNLSYLKILRLFNNKLTGVIPPETGNLGNLEELHLSSTYLSGSIPAELGNLTHLRILRLNSNFTGSIPASLGNLSQLGFFELVGNQLSGSIPASFGNLGNVADLWLNGNQLSGNIPAELGNLPYIKRLFLHHNRLSGEIPANLMNLNTISDLDIGYNCLYSLDPTLRIWLNVHDPDWEAHQDQCDGVPPAIILSSPNGGEIFAIGSSHTITWSTINMTGDVKIEYTFDNGSSWNEITAAAPNTGSYDWIVPDTASSLCKIKISKASTGNPFDISNGIFSIIPESTASLTVLSPNGGETMAVGYTYSITWASTGTITNVKIEYTRDNGSSWETIAAAAPNTGSYNWTVPDINDSQCKIVIREAITGTPVDASDGPFFIVKSVIPAEERAALIVFFNSTNGDNWTNNSGWKTQPLYADGFAMPGTEVRWHGITVMGDHVTKIEMYENNLSGNIPPEIGILSKLQIIYLTSNVLSGSIPSSLGNLNDLHHLYLSQNVLSGTIPLNLMKLTNLVYLELSNNRLSGNIPPELENLSNLDVLQLDGNQFSGSIPAALGKLMNLGRLYLNANRLSGSIPPEFGGLVSLKDIDLSGNPLTGIIPPEFGNLQNLGILSIASTQISGSIPHELGTLVKLKEIYLRGNQLNGDIPSELGNLHNLLNLCLENNKLSGEIPTSLTNLSNITTLNLGYNCLKSTNTTLRNWLNLHDPDWETHQDQCNSPTPTITLISPNGGENWAVGSSYSITWSYTGTIENVKIEYTTDNGSQWTMITAAAPNTGFYTWTVPNAVSSLCKIKISDASLGNPWDTSDAVFSIIGKPSIHLNRTKLHFNANKNGAVTKPQEVRISNDGGGGILNWQISSGTSWLNGSPSSGTGDGIISVAVNPDGLAEGTYTGSIIVSDPNATNSPQTIDVTLKVKVDAPDMGPFGEFSTPVDGSEVSSSIPVTGWVLDETGVQDVKIYREETDGSLAFIGDAVFVDGARPDVEILYPDYPHNYKAGWGYMLLTNFLPNEGNGTFKLHAVATDGDGHNVTLGIKTIVVDNVHAVKPFGALDTPMQGGIASGKSFMNWGWVLTPQPNGIPIDGSTIAVWIDGLKIGRPVYNNYREDIAELFPGYANSNGAVGYFYLDTAKYKNGVHTIQWTAAD
ncbi:MAG TPA: hypothetical protein VK469_05900, partial [Candidatus Kapabacteria bacterium]|nr:hypothetical protein [Candidatus Kapabacteria bacterium]